MERRRKPCDVLASLLLSTYTKLKLQMLMLESMPISAMPSGSKPKLIKKFIDWMCEANDEELIYCKVLARVHKRDLLGHLSLHGHQFLQKTPKAFLVESFRVSDTRLWQGIAPADRESTAIVLAEANRSADEQIVPAFPALRKRLFKRWAKKAHSFLTRTDLSHRIRQTVGAVISDKGKHVLIRDIKQAVADRVCDVSHGQAAIFFYRTVHKRIRAYFAERRAAAKRRPGAAKRRPRRKAKAPLSVPPRRAHVNVMAEWRERQAMWAADDWEWKT